MKNLDQGNSSGSPAPEIVTRASEDAKMYPLLVESIDHMKLTPKQKEFAKAVMRTAIEYAAMRRAGFVLEANL